MYMDKDLLEDELHLILDQFSKGKKQTHNVLFNIFKEVATIL